MGHVEVFDFTIQCFVKGGTAERKVGCVARRQVEIRKDGKNIKAHSSVSKYSSTQPVRGRG